MPLTASTTNSKQKISKEMIKNGDNMCDDSWINLCLICLCFVVAFAEMVGGQKSARSYSQTNKQNYATKYGLSQTITGQNGSDLG